LTVTLIQSLGHAFKTNEIKEVLRGAADKNLHWLVRIALVCE